MDTILPVTNIFYVYEHWRPDKGECFYVGKGHGKRAYNMSSCRNTHHKNIQKTLSKMGAVVEIKLYASGLEEAEAFNIEKARISFWRAQGCTLVNWTDGGEGPAGLKRSEEQRKMIGERAKGNTYLRDFKLRGGKQNFSPQGYAKMCRPKSDATKKLLSDLNKGKVLSNEVKKKVGNASLKRWEYLRANPEEYAAFVKKRSQAMVGRKLSPEHIAKMSASRRGRPSPLRGVKLSPERVIQCGLANKGRKCPPEAIEIRRAKLLASWKDNDDRKIRLIALRYAGGKGKFSEIPEQFLEMARQHIAERARKKSLRRPSFCSAEKMKSAWTPERREAARNRLLSRQRREDGTMIPFAESSTHVGMEN